MVKLPHHGSKLNLSLNLLDCDRYLFSTDGTWAARHPNPVAVARLVTSRTGVQLEFKFNYRGALDIAGTRRSRVRVVHCASE